MECEVCQAERKRRCRVIFPGGWNDGAHTQEPFAHAPYIHPWNAPKYQAQQLRAISFAKATNQRLLWVTARDWPIPTAEEKFTEARLETLRVQFLQLHDKKTAGIMGLLPLVRNLPVRLTQTEDAKVGAVKNARGTLIGWTLPESEAARVAALSDAEVVLAHRPEQLLIKLKAPLPGLPDTYGEGVYCMTPKIRVWSRDNAGYAKVTHAVSYTCPPSLWPATAGVLPAGGAPRPFRRVGAIWSHATGGGEMRKQRRQGIRSVCAAQAWDKR
jgi:hypothetical protein